MPLCLKNIGWFRPDVITRSRYTSISRCLNRSSSGPKSSVGNQCIGVYLPSFRDRGFRTIRIVSWSFTSTPLLMLKDVGTDARTITQTINFCLTCISEFVIQSFTRILEISCFIHLENLVSWGDLNFSEQSKLLCSHKITLPDCLISSMFKIAIKTSQLLFED